MSNFKSDSALLVDLYELTMAAGYFYHNYNPVVTFELFARYLPENRNYLIASGIEDAINFVLNLKFEKDEIEYLRSLDQFKNVGEDFFKYLENFNFSGNIYAIREGELIFANEPILQIEAPLIEAQILETYLLASINFQTSVASKASRIVQAAQSDGIFRGVMEFGSRRAHGPEAGVLAARASYIAGCIGTSNVLAGYKFDIPVYGTAAHSWTLAFENELEAFKKYSEVFPESSIYLIDTYNTINGAVNATRTGYKFIGVRIDSGDLAENSKKVRKILDENGFVSAKIIVSGDLNEYKIEKLVKAKAPIDSFGVGTQLSTSADAPYIPVVYKLVEVEKDKSRVFKAKFSPEKQTYPGRKQIYRIEENGFFKKDFIDLANSEIQPNGNKLLLQWVKNGEQVAGFPDLEKTKFYALENLKKLPEKFFDLSDKTDYKIEFSVHLEKILSEVKKKYFSQNNGG